MGTGGRACACVSVWQARGRVGDRLCVCSKGVRGVAHTWGPGTNGTGMQSVCCARLLASLSVCLSVCHVIIIMAAAWSYPIISYPILSRPSCPILT